MLQTHPQAQAAWDAKTVDSGGGGVYYEAEEGAAYQNGAYQEVSRLILSLMSTSNNCH